MEKLIEDIKYGFRTLIANPMFTLISVLTLTLGIGTTTAMFTLVNNVLLQPLPFPNPNELVHFNTLNKKKDQLSTNITINFLDSMQQVETPMQEMAYYAYESATLAKGDQQKPFTMLITSHNYLSMFGVKPQLGRWYEQRDINTQSIVISHDVWANDLAGNPNVLEDTIKINNQDFQVVGVMPPNYSSTGYTSVDFWLPINTLDRPVQVVARLKPNMNIAQAGRQSTAIQRLINEVSGDSENVWEAHYTSMMENIIGDSKPALYLLLASVAAVFLIAVLNVVNLTFAQYSNRTQELAVRISVGASRMRLFRQLLTESMLLSVIGGLLGLLLSAWTLEWIKDLMASRLPRLHETGLDQGALLTVLVLISLSALATTLIPSQSVVNPNKLSNALKQAGRKVTEDKNHQRVRRILVSGEVCVAVVLLICAGLLLRSYQQLSGQDVGFNTNNVVTGHVWLPDNFNPQPNRSGYWLTLVDNLKQLPNVNGVAATSTMPMGRTGIDYPVNYTFPGAPAVPRGEEPSASVRSITPDYFSLLQVPVLSGREFDFRDTADSPKVVIINRALADASWPGQEAVGNILSLPNWMGGNHTVVGVVDNVKHRGLKANPVPEFFLPVTQHSYPGMTLLIKTSEEAIGAIKNQMLQASVQMEATAPMIQIATLQELTSESIVSEKLLLTILAVFAVIALLLASIGVYGISDNMVSQRTNEIGIRMAVGARPKVIKHWIIRDASRPVLIGAIVGLLLAFILSQFIASILYGVNALDPFTFISVPAILMLVGIIATWVPARRATRVHPQQALHYE